MERRMRKNSGGAAADGGGRPSRKSTPTGCGREKGRANDVGGGVGSGGSSGGSNSNEKAMAFMSNKYDSVAGGTTPSFGPGVDGVRFQTPKRANTAKKKTQSYWTGFILWLRTRLFRLGRK